MTPRLVHFAARQLMMAAYLYYNCHETIMPDETYDKLSGFVAEHWTLLPLQYQECMESPEATRASGSHFMVSAACVGAALEWFHSEHGYYPEQGRQFAPDGSWDGPGGETVEVMGLSG